MIGKLIIKSQFRSEQSRFFRPVKSTFEVHKLIKVVKRDAESNFPTLSLAFFRERLQFR